MNFVIELLLILNKYNYILIIINKFFKFVRLIFENKKNSIEI